MSFMQAKDLLELVKEHKLFIVVYEDMSEEVLRVLDTEDKLGVFGFALSDGSGKAWLKIGRAYELTSLDSGYLKSILDSFLHRAARRKLKLKEGARVREVL